MSKVRKRAAPAAASPSRRAAPASFVLEGSRFHQRESFERGTARSPVGARGAGWLETRAEDHARRVLEGGDASIREPPVAADGRPLSPRVQSFFGPRFGHDFSAVRVHADRRAATAAGQRLARAFTTGNRITFAAGQYDLTHPPGRRLLAHELAHVVQQARGEAPWGRPQAERWFRGFAVGVAPNPSGTSVGGHDLGPGTYFSDRRDVARQYAATRSGKASAQRIATVDFDRRLLGRVLDLTRNAKWEAYLTKMSGGSPQVRTMLLHPRNYQTVFKGFLGEQGLKLADFDAVIGPEGIRGGKQLCIRPTPIGEKALEQIRRSQQVTTPAPAATTTKKGSASRGKGSAPSVKSSAPSVKGAVTPGKGSGGLGKRALARGRSRTLLRGAGGAVVLGAMLLAEIIFQLTIGRKIRELQAKLERAKVERIEAEIRARVQRSLSIWQKRIARELSAQSARMSQLKASGKQPYVRYTFKVEFEDTSGRLSSLLDDDPPESVFDLRVHDVEYVKAEVVGDFPKSTATPLEAAREFALLGKGRHKRAWHLLTGIGGYLFESTITFGSVLEGS